MAAAVDYDVIVIGGGPAGYPAAIRAAQNGLKVACVDAWRNRDGSSALGGTCLNAGCIPSKALLESSELYHRAHSEFATHGIKLGSVTLDLAAMQKRRATIVKNMTTGITALLKSAGVTTVFGRGTLQPGRVVEVTAHDGMRKQLSARHVVLASGSVPTELRSVPFVGKTVIDSWSALELDAVPGRLCVIGAGVIGLELGSVWKRLGAEVVVLEALEKFLPMADAQLAAEAARHFKKQGWISAGQGQRRYDQRQRRYRQLCRRQGRADAAGGQGRGRGGASSLHHRPAGRRHGCRYRRTRLHQGR
jgi:dihydrolipoamide dehydrogenase